MAWNSYIGAFGSSSGAHISCSGACSSSSRACISSSGKRLQSLEAPGALSFSRGLAFSPSGTTTLPHINHACFSVSNIQIHSNVTFVMEHSNKWKKHTKKHFWTFQHVRKKYLPPACFGESISRGLHPLTLIHPNPPFSLQNYPLPP